MAVRIHQALVRGVIDNRVRGRVTGELWFSGRHEPLRLELAGNCQRDLAGCRLEITNPKPTAGGQASVTLAPVQHGVAGEITAARKVRLLHPDFWATRKSAGQAAAEALPEGKGNALYLEWYSRTNGRVVIESADFQLNVTLPEWELTVDEEKAQQVRAANAMRGFLSELTTAIEAERGERDMAADTGADDEFAWEKILRGSDLRSQKLAELEDQYGDSPDGELRILREMGWPGLAEAVEAARADGFPLAGGVAEDADDDDAWRGAVGELPAEAWDPPRRHALVERSSALAKALIDERRRHQGAPDEAPARDLAELQSIIGCWSGKLAGATSGLGTSCPPPPGMVVALLKRALAWFNEAQAVLARLDVAQPPALPPEKLAALRAEVFALRADMLVLMAEQRRHQSE